jgi:hypothetical protein
MRYKSLSIGLMKILMVISFMTLRFDDDMKEGYPLLHALTRNTLIYYVLSLK